MQSDATFLPNFENRSLSDIVIICKVSSHSHIVIHWTVTVNDKVASSFAQCQSGPWPSAAMCPSPRMTAASSWAGFAVKIMLR